MVHGTIPLPPPRRRRSSKEKLGGSGSKQLLNSLLADNSRLHDDFAQLSDIFRATEQRIQLLEGTTPAPSMASKSTSLAQPQFKHSGLVFA